MQEPRFNEFQGTKVIVNDLDRSAAWYRNVCGLEELMRVKERIADEGITEVLFKGNGGPMPFAPFMLVKYDRAQKNSNSGVVLIYITDDLAAFLGRARANAGVVVEDIRVVEEHRSRVAFVRDCEGHLIEVVEPMK